MEIQSGAATVYCLGIVKCGGHKDGQYDGGHKFDHCEFHFFFSSVKLPF